MEHQEKKGLTMRVLDWIEKVGNKLPHPVTLFGLFALLVILASWVFATIGLEVEDPATGETLQIVNLLSSEGIKYIFESMVDNFVGVRAFRNRSCHNARYRIAERSGLISALLRGLVTSVPQFLMTAALVFGGIMSSMAADAGYVVLTPLGAVLFAGLGRHPLAGLAAAFAGVSAGFSANLLPTSLDPLLGELTKASRCNHQP